MEQDAPTELVFNLMVLSRSRGAPPELSKTLPPMAFYGVEDLTPGAYPGERKEEDVS